MGISRLADDDMESVPDLRYRGCAQCADPGMRFSGSAPVGQSLGRAICDEIGDADRCAHIGADPDILADPHSGSDGGADAALEADAQTDRGDEDRDLHHCVRQ